MHWRKKRGPHWLKSALVNGLGGFVTGVTVIVVLVAKFVEGAWITVIFIPLLIFFFSKVRRHYHFVTVSTTTTTPVTVPDAKVPPIVVVPIDTWNRISKQGIEFASHLSSKIIAIHVEHGEHAELLHENWDRYVADQFRNCGQEPPELVILPSPYRFVIVPIVKYVLDLSDKFPDRRIAVVIPELVEEHWYEYFLHNQRGRLLEWTFLAKGNDRIYTVTAPYYLAGVPHELA